MKAPYSHWLARWSKAGLIDEETVRQIEVFEKSTPASEGLPWPVWVALGFGGLMLAAGILLFVGAHWDELSPLIRFLLVLQLVLLFHLAGSGTHESFPALSTTFHGIGTVALGASVFLTGQIFHLETHWPAGVLLWAIGAWAGWWILKDWVHGVIAVVLTPAWLTAWWVERTSLSTHIAEVILIDGLLLLAIAYMSAHLPDIRSELLIAISWIGLAASVPLAILAAASLTPRGPESLEWPLALLGWTAAVLLPLGTGWLLRGREAWPLLGWTLWVLLLSLVFSRQSGVGLYAWCAIGSIGLVAWGARDSSVPRVNLGTVFFALTISAFYFSSVMDMLGRAFGLIGLGLLFLLGGWGIEKTRRRLVELVRRGGL